MRVVKKNRPYRRAMSSIGAGAVLAIDGTVAWATAGASAAAPGNNVYTGCISACLQMGPFTASKPIRQRLRFATVTTCRSRSTKRAPGCHRCSGCHRRYRPRRHDRPRRRKWR